MQKLWHVQCVACSNSNLSIFQWTMENGYVYRSEKVVNLTNKQKKVDSRIENSIFETTLNLPSDDCDFHTEITKKKKTLLLVFIERFVLHGNNLIIERYFFSVYEHIQTARYFAGTWTYSRINWKEYIIWPEWHTIETNYEKKVKIYFCIKYVSISLHLITRPHHTFNLSMATIAFIVG